MSPAKQNLGATMKDFKMSEQKDTIFVSIKKKKKKKCYLCLCSLL